MESHGNTLTQTTALLWPLCLIQYQTLRCADHTYVSLFFLRLAIFLPSPSPSLSLLLLSSSDVCVTLSWPAHNCNVLASGALGYCIMTDSVTVRAGVILHALMILDVMRQHRRDGWGWFLISSESLLWHQACYFSKHDEALKNNSKSRQSLDSEHFVCVVECRTALT